MPEEINRIVADQVSPAPVHPLARGRENLLAEGRSAESIHDVGNTMIDSLVAMRERIDEAGAPEAALAWCAATTSSSRCTGRALVDGTLLGRGRRGAGDGLGGARGLFPVHPRTRAALETLGVDVASERLRLIEPVGYIEFLSLVAGSAGVLTDSGGIQEETTYLGLPCFTLRANTERPITVSLGTNTLLGLEPARIGDVPALLSEARERDAQVPPLWDGHAAERIVDVLSRTLDGELAEQLDVAG